MLDDRLNFQDDQVAQQKDRKPGHSGFRVVQRSGAQCGSQKQQIVRPVAAENPDQIKRPPPRIDSEVLDVVNLIEQPEIVQQVGAEPAPGELQQKHGSKSEVEETLRVTPISTYFRSVNVTFVLPMKKVLPNLYHRILERELNAKFTCLALFAAVLLAMVLLFSSRKEKEAGSEVGAGGQLNDFQGVGPQSPAFTVDDRREDRESEKSGTLARFADGSEGSETRRSTGKAAGEGSRQDSPSHPVESAPDFKEVRQSVVRDYYRSVSRGADLSWAERDLLMHKWFLRNRSKVNEYFSSPNYPTFEESLEEHASQL